MRKLLAPFAAITLLLATAGVAMAWKPPTLTSHCAPDENTFAWTINLPSKEDSWEIQFSWDNFATPPFDTIDFGSGGDHDFTTPRGGSTLYARWKAEHDSGTSLSGDSKLCVEPEQSVEAATGTPSGTLSNSAISTVKGPGPLPAILFSMVLLGSLGTLAYANVKGVARRNR